MIFQDEVACGTRLCFLFDWNMDPELYHNTYRPHLISMGKKKGVVISSTLVLLLLAIVLILISTLFAPEGDIRYMFFILVAIIINLIVTVLLVLACLHQEFVTFIEMCVEPNILDSISRASSEISLPILDDPEHIQTIIMRV